MCILRCGSTFCEWIPFSSSAGAAQRLISCLLPISNIYYCSYYTCIFYLVLLFFIARVVSCSQLMVIMTTMKKWGDRNKAICLTGSNPDLPFFYSLCIISKIGVSNKDVQLFIWLYQLSVVAAVLLLLFLWSDINAMHEFCLLNSSAGYPFHRLFQSLFSSPPFPGLVTQWNTANIQQSQFSTQNNEMLNAVHSL